MQNPVERIIHLMQTDDSVDAPADAIKWSKNIFKTRAVRERTSLKDKILAILKVDLAPNKAAFGERSASAGKARQMLFEAGENSIDLRVRSTGSGFEIRGQILGEGFVNARVSLGNSTTRTNELSEFRFENVSAGEYDLEIEGEKILRIAGIDLKINE